MTVDAARAEPRGADDAARGIGRARERIAIGVDAATVLGVAVIEGGIAVAGFLALAPLAMLVVVHVVAVGLLAWRIVVLARQGRDTVRLMVATIFTAAAGPVGAVVGVLGALAVPRQVTATPLLTAWYERIAQATRSDPVTSLCDSVAIGRGLDLSAPVPTSFATVIRGGSLGEQQAALGLVARSYHPAYIRALTRALRSPEPVIRVQAAAVAARLRSGIAGSLEQAIARSRTVTGTLGMLELVAEIDAAAGSGLVDQTLAVRGVQASRRLKTQMLTALSSVDCGIVAARLVAAGRTGAGVVGEHLVAVLEQQLAEAKLWSHLRAAGRGARVARSGHSVRRLRGRPGRKAGAA
jgi:hypothetical protein